MWKSGSNGIFFDRQPLVHVEPKSPRRGWFYRANSLTRWRASSSMRMHISSQS